MTDPIEYTRRTYTVEGPELDQASRIELIVKVDGRAIVQVQAREPGMLAFVSKPEDQGFDIEIIQPSKGAYRDTRVPHDRSDSGEPLPWQVDALT